MGYICCIRSHDGADKVGLIKSMAILTHLNIGYD